MFGWWLGNVLCILVFCIPVTAAEEPGLGSRPAAPVLGPRRASLAPMQATHWPETANVLASSGAPGTWHLNGGTVHTGM